MLEIEIARREQDFVSHYGESSRAEGKSIPRVSPLVSIMLTSELSTLVAYGVPGVDAAVLRAHLDDMVTLVGLIGGKPVITGPQVVLVGE